MDNNLFKEKFTYLGEYYDKKFTNALALMYWDKLKHLTNEQFTAATDECINTYRVFPGISNILRVVPAGLALENKSSLSWCQNTQALIDNYGDVTV